MAINNIFHIDLHAPVRYVILASLLVLAACSRPAFRSQRFYTENQQLISAIVNRYQRLYPQQPFNFGFTDKSHHYVSVEVKTDTLRYIFNTERLAFRLDTLLPKLGIDTTELRALAMDLHRSGGLWLGTNDFYVDRAQYRVTYLSFGAVALPSVFTEGKYYVLVFPDKSWPASVQEKIRSKGNLREVNDSVLFTISNRFK